MRTIDLRHDYSINHIFVPGFVVYVQKHPLLHGPPDYDYRVYRAADFAEHFDPPALYSRQVVTSPILHEIVWFTNMNVVFDRQLQLVWCLTGNTMRKIELSTGDQISQFRTIDADNFSALSTPGPFALTTNQVYLLDRRKGHVIIFDRLEGTIIRRLTEFGLAALVRPHDIAIYKGEMFISQGTDKCINVFDLDGHYRREIVVKGDKHYAFNPTKIRFDEQGNLFVLTHSSDLVFVFNGGSGELITTFHIPIRSPRDIVVDPETHLIFFPHKTNQAVTVCGFPL